MLRAYELIDGAQIMRDLFAIADISLPQNEGQARELRRLKSPEERCAKWKEVVASAGNDSPLTANLSVTQFTHHRRDRMDEAMPSEAPTNIETSPGQNQHDH